MRHDNGIWPLVTPAGRVTVDGHPICDRCGEAVTPAGPSRWRHGYVARSRWLEPVTWSVLAGLRTYDEFVERYPWTVRPELGSGAVTTEADWREGIRRLRAYHAAPDTTVNPYLGRMSMLLGGGLTRGLAAVLDLPARRRELIGCYAWAVPTDAALDLLARYGPLVECGAGTGYWAALLGDRGVDVLAFDAQPPPCGQARFSEVRIGESPSVAGRHPDRSLLMCWPPYGDDVASYATLRAYRGTTICYIGEAADGATGSVRFHRELALNWRPVEHCALPNWQGQRDRLVVYRRRDVRLPHRTRDRCHECGRYVRTGWIGRCERCFETRPPALALRRGQQRIEYRHDSLERLPIALRLAFEASPDRIPV